MDYFDMHRTNFQCVYLLLVLVPAVLAATTTSTPDPSPQPQDGVTTAAPLLGKAEGVLDRPIDKSMEPIYSMTNWFVESALYPKSFVEIANKTDLETFRDILNSLQSDWQIWASHYISLVVCTVFTVIYTLGLPLAGLIVCCCRSRGKCGGNTSPFDRKYTKHKRRACAIVLGFFMTLLLLGVTSSFIANQLIHEQTNDNMTHTMTSSVQSIQNHKKLTIEQLDQTFLTNFPSDSAALSSEVNKFPQEVQKEVGISTKSGVLLESARNYLASVNNTLQVLVDIDSVTAHLNANISSLNKQLADENTKLRTDFDSCKDQIDYCKELVGIADKPWDTVASFSNLQNKMQTHVSVFRAETRPHSGLSAAFVEFNRISGIVETVAAGDVEALSNVTESLNADVASFQKSAADQISQFSVEFMEEEINSTINPWINTIGNYRYYGGIALSTLALLVTTFVSIGLLLGACGERAGEDAQSCNRGQAACCLMTASGFIFGLSWILAICSLVLLVLGSIAHNDLCTHLVEKQDKAAMNLLSDLMVKSFNISAINKDMSLFDVLIKCEEDPGIYSAAQIDRINPALNITKALDLADYTIGTNLDNLRSAIYTIGLTIVLANDDFINGLYAIEQELFSIDFSDHESEMVKNITSVDIADVVNLVDTAISDPNVTDQTFRSNIAQYKNRMTLLETYKAEITQYKDMLKTLINSIKSTRNSLNATSFETELREAERKIDGATLKDGSAKVADDIQGSFQALTADYDEAARNRVGRCGVVYESVTDAIDSVCVQFLYPFNAYWYSIGWCLCFFIPTIVVMFYLVGLYRKTDKYEPLEEEEASNHDTGAQVATTSADADSAPGYYPPDTPSSQRPLPSIPGGGRGVDNHGYLGEGRQRQQSSYQDRMYDGADYRTGRGYGGGGNVDSYSNDGYNNGGYRY